MSTTIKLRVQQLGDQLAVCIPAEIAKSARLTIGQPVTLKIPSTANEISNAENLVPTLDQMLAQYDPEKFDCEVLAAPLIGKET